jgi:hypothetical protein
MEFSRRRQILFSLLPAILLFGTAELSLRLLGIPPQKDLVREFAFPPERLFGVAFDRDPARFWRLIPGYDGPWRLYKRKYTYERGVAAGTAELRYRNFPNARYFDSVTWGVNEHGFRGDSPESRKRIILFIGSSITFGWGVREDDSFVGLLRARLAREGYRDWDVVNAGVPGYSSYQSLIYLNQIVDQWQPDVVVIESGINDGLPSAGSSDRLASSADPRSSGLEKVVWSSNLALALRYAWQDTVTPPSDNPRVESEPFFHTSMFSPGRSRVPEADFRANISEFEVLADAAGAETFFLFPGLYNEYGRGALRKAVRFEHPREIDMVAGLERAATGNLGRLFLPYDEAHLSRRGHRLVAKLIWSRLIEEETLEPSIASP